MSTFSPSYALAYGDKINIIKVNSNNASEPSKLSSNEIEEADFEKEKSISANENPKNDKRSTTGGYLETLGISEPYINSPLMNSNKIEPVSSSRQSSDFIEISSFDDLKKELEIKDQKLLSNDSGKRLFLKNWHYKLINDIEINLSDSFFDDKYEYIKNGILSIGNSTNDPNHTAIPDNFILDGNNHKITIVPKKGQSALPLFGGIISKATYIKNLNLVIDGDVIGYPFADIITSMQSENSEGYIQANGLVDNISVKVKGSVVPQFYPYEESSKRLSIIYNNDFAGNFTGSMATGFAIKVVKTHLNNIKVDIDGNIGSDKVQSLDNNYKTWIKNGFNYCSGAFGFLWCSEDANYMGPVQNPWSKTRTAIFREGNYSLLRNLSYIENVDIKIGGSIFATGYDNAYAAGFMESSDNSWVDKVNIDINGDIKTTLKGGDEASNPYGNSGMSASFAHGFCESLSNFTNSKLNVNNIIMEVSDSYNKKSSYNRKNIVSEIGGIGYDSGNGTVIRLINNEINIKNSMKATTSIHLIATAGFYNTWNGNSKDGVNWRHFFDGNKINIGQVNLEQNSDSVIQYYGFGEKFRTGNLSESEKKNGYKPLEAVSAKNNELNVGKLIIKNHGKDDSYVYPSFYNAANAKNNIISYENIDIDSKKLKFIGLGNIVNEEPKEDNEITEVTENNILNFGDIRVESVNSQTMSLGAGIIDEGKTLKNNKIQVGKVDANFGKLENGNLITINPKKFYFSGLACFNKGIVDDNHIFVKNINLFNTSSTYFGLGAAFNKGQFKNSTILVDDASMLPLLVI